MTGTTHSPHQSLRVLFVDDEVPLQDLLRAELSRLGHEVTVCANGRAAVKVLEKSTFDAAILDLKMPGMSGIELLYGLARRVGARVRFILCSAHSALDQVAPQHPLVSGRLAKPVEPGELESLLASASDALEAATVH